MLSRSVVAASLVGVLASGCSTVVGGQAPQGALGDQRVLFEGVLSGHPWQLVEGTSDMGPALQTWRNGRLESTTSGFTLPDEEGLLTASAHAPLAGDDPGAPALGLLLGHVLVGAAVDRVVIVQGGVAVASETPKRSDLLGVFVSPIAVEGLARHVWVVACDGEAEVGASIAWTPPPGGGSGLDDVARYCEAAG